MEQQDKTITILIHKSKKTVEQWEKLIAEFYGVENYSEIIHSETLDFWGFKIKKSHIENIKKATNEIGIEFNIVDVSIFNPDWFEQ